MRKGLLLLSLLIGGCATGNEFTGIRNDIAEVSQQIAAMQVNVNATLKAQLSAGGDINEPVTGWILAIGYASVPVTILAYVLAHRSKRFRRLKDKIRGKNCG